MNEELRLYTFTNFYLSSIQQGIQSGHALGELMLAASFGGIEGSDMLYDWAENHKTMICLNGGDVDGVTAIFDFLNQPENPFPCAPFYESAGALGGILTSVAIVLPARIFNTAGLLRSRVLPTGITYTFDKFLNEHRFTFTEQDTVRVDTFTPWEYELMQRLNGCGLAR